MPTCANHHESEDGDFCTVCGIEITPANSPAAPSPSGPAAPGECPKCHAEHDPDSGPFCEICGYNFKTGESGLPFALEEVPPPKPAPRLAVIPEPVVIEPAPPAPSAPPPAIAAPSTPPLPVIQALAPPEPVAPAPPTATSAPAVPVVENSPLAADPAARWEFVATVDLSIMNVPEAEGPADRHERVFHLDLPEELVGRRSQRRNINPDISLDTDDGVSHRHAKVIRQPDGSVSILDMGSSNGTTVNGVDLKSNVLTPLAAGDRVCLGRWTCLTIRARS